MGIMGHFSCSGGAHTPNHKNKKKQFQRVEMKVKVDCEGCERKVRRSVEGMKGIESIEIEPKLHKLTVTGYIEPNKVVARVAHRTGKKVELWPYVQYDDMKLAPPGYVHFSEPRIPV